MMKLILVIAFVALAFPREAECLKCYHCKSEQGLLSSIVTFNSLPLCSEKMEESPTETSGGVDFAECKKIIEKVQVGDKEKKLIIRALVKREENIDLSGSNLVAYSCKEDLCNSASIARDVAVGVVLLVAAAIFLGP